MGSLYLLLYLFFFLVGSVLVLLGVDLDDVDVWLAGYGHWFEFVGSWLLRLICAAILALCVFAFLGGLWQKLYLPRSGKGEVADFAEEQEQHLGWGCMIMALVVGYFAWVGVAG
jgi:succinate dehydrogenase/fumarate reductase cytochrome b subunit